MSTIAVAVVIIVVSMFSPATNTVTRIIALIGIIIMSGSQTFAVGDFMLRVVEIKLDRLRRRSRGCSR